MLGLKVIHDEKKKEHFIYSFTFPLVYQELVFKK